jgi:hypothetical protein
LKGVTVHFAIIFNDNYPSTAPEVCYCCCPACCSDTPLRPQHLLFQWLQARQ